MTFQVYRDRRGEWHWRLLAANNRTLADSVEGYVKVSDCLHAIALVKHARWAEVVETDR